MLLFVLAVLLHAGSSPAQAGNDLHINQLQIIGTHNSYHAGLTTAEAKLLSARNPRAARALEYHHAPLSDQLNAGVRQIELDVFYDPQGGRYAHPANLSMIAATGTTDAPYDPAHDMDKPGFKVMHVQDLDQRSTCPLLSDCLKQIHSWSQAHPNHIPVFILLETKQGKLPQLPQAREPLPFTPAVFDALEAEVLSVFPRTGIVTPDEVRGSFQTLPEAVAHRNWPTLAQARGKVVFLLDQRSNESIYTEGHPALRGRLAFTNAVPGAPDAAFTEENNPPAAEIDGLVRQGYLVRTRTDTDTEQARSNDTSRRNAVLDSGAQILSTDYPASEPASWSGFSVSLPGNAVVRCNPILTVATCEVSEDK